MRRRLLDVRHRAPLTLPVFRIPIGPLLVLVLVASFHSSLNAGDIRLLPPQRWLPATRQDAPQWWLPATRQDAPPCPAHPVHPSHIRALLVGVDKYKSKKIGRLDGATRDAELLQQALIGSGGSPHDVTVLLDEAATQLNLETALDTLIASTQCGDVVVFAFSGHSGRGPGPSDESFELYCQDSSPDWRNNGGPSVLTAPVLRRIITAIRNRGAFTFILLDAAYTANGNLDAASRSGNWRSSPFGNPILASDPSDSLRPGAGGYAGVFVKGEGIEIMARGGIFGALTFSFATSLLAAPDHTIRQLARDTFRTASTFPGFESSAPVFEATDPDLAPFSNSITTAPPARQPRQEMAAVLGGPWLEITQPIPTRGVLVAQHRSVHIEGRVVPGGDIVDAVVVGNRQASLASSGSFTADLELEPGRQPLYAVALFRDHTNASATFEIDVAAGSVESGPGKRYALVIGNAAYSNGWNPLTTPTLDADEVARILHERFEFQLELPPRHSGEKPFSLVLKNASNAEMQHALFQLARLSPDDTVLVFYAGHGSHDVKTGISYWIPVDAASDEPALWLSAETINGYLAKTDARHVLVVSDSCFSGTMAMRDNTPARPIDPKYREERRQYLATMLRRPSRNLLSSGGDEPVADAGGHGHSVFAWAFLRELEEYPEEQFTVKDIEQNLRQRVVGNSPGQVPRVIYLGKSGDEGGDLVFFRKK